MAGARFQSKTLHASGCPFCNFTIRTRLLTSRTYRSHTTFLASYLSSYRWKHFWWKEYFIINDCLLKLCYVSYVLNFILILSILNTFVFLKLLLQICVVDGLKFDSTPGNPNTWKELEHKATKASIFCYITSRLTRKKRENEIYLRLCCGQKIDCFLTRYLKFNPN